MHNLHTQRLHSCKKKTALRIPYPPGLINSMGLKSYYTVYTHFSGSWRRPIPRGIVPKPPDLANNCTAAGMTVPTHPFHRALTGLSPPDWSVHASHCRSLWSRQKHDRLRSYLPRENCKLFLHESRRYVCRFCTSHLVRVKKELLYRSHPTAIEKPQNKPTTKQNQSVATFGSSFRFKPI